MPLAKWYLKKERRFTKGDIQLAVRPGVFHPGLFSSTLFLFEFLKQCDLRNQSLLELGCGSGFLSIVTAKAGAKVTASDISERAVRNAQHNTRLNQVNVTVIHSDLFDQLPCQTFDWIIINPPYYPQQPNSESDFAWYCGEEFEYFRKLFRQLRAFMDEHTTVLMVLTKGCDLDSIFAVAQEYQFRFTLLREKSVLFDERDFIYQIQMD